MESDIQHRHNPESQHTVSETLANRPLVFKLASLSIIEVSLHVWVELLPTHSLLTKETT